LAVGTANNTLRGGERERERVGWAGKGMGRWVDRQTDRLYVRFGRDREI
jgi:hypothetical protein